MISIIKDQGFELMYSVPYFLKLLEETEGGTEALRKLKMVLFAGSSCPDALGNRLVDAGVHLVSVYGS